MNSIYALINHIGSHIVFSEFDCTVQSRASPLEYMHIRSDMCVV